MKRRSLLQAILAAPIMPRLPAPAMAATRPVDVVVLGAASFPTNWSRASSATYFARRLTNDELILISK